MNPIHICMPYSLKQILILSSHLHIVLPSSPFPSGFPISISYTFLNSTSATSPTYLIFLHLITLIFGEMYNYEVHYTVLSILLLLPLS